MIDYSWLLVIVAYCVGSICSAIVVCRVMSLPDPREQGSGNPGATNVMRFGGKKAAAITLFGDLIKGLLPVLLGQLLNVSTELVACLGAAAFLGHLYPIFFGFEGGKGVATSDIKIQAEQMSFTKKKMAELISFHTGQKPETIEADSDRDRWFTAEDAKTYGFVDHVVRSAGQVSGSGGTAK